MSDCQTTIQSSVRIEVGSIGYNTAQKQTGITHLTTEQRRELVCSMYLEGKSIEEIQNAAIGSCKAIYKILKEAGIRHRSGARNKPNRLSSAASTPVGKSKLCTKCRERKDLIYFPETGSRGCSSWCNGCHSAHKRLIRYGISETTIAILLKIQGGKCGLCPRPIIKYHVDHNHKTGKVRGLLCGSCNIRLGGWDDDRFRQAALDWLDNGGMQNVPE